MQVTRDWRLDLLHPVLTFLVLLDAGCHTFTRTLYSQPFAEFHSSDVVMMVGVPMSVMVAFAFWSADVVRRVVKEGWPRRWLLAVVLGGLSVGGLCFESARKYTTDMEEWNPKVNLLLPPPDCVPPRPGSAPTTREPAPP